VTEKIWADDPLVGGLGDTLGREPYARAAAELIAGGHSFDTSVVFGLSGPWGSGKSSLINMIVRELTTEHPDWQIARFTPWATSDVSGLLSEFYSSLAEPLPAEKKAALKKSLGVIARVAAPAAGLIPFAGIAAGNVVNFLAERLERAEPWQKAFDDAAARLRELNIPILVIVDDIDRLQQDELTTLLKVVRLLGRFPGVQYLLAYDDDTLFRTLSTGTGVTRDGSAERFMEKIVQYPLLVPPLLEHQQLARLNQGLITVARQSTADGRISALRNCFVALLRTPRAIDRYIAQLHHHLPMVGPDEIDDEDVYLLTLLRVTFPALFNAIPRYRSELTSGTTGDVSPSPSAGAGIEWVRFDPGPLLATVPEQQRGVAEQLLFSLFPKVAPDKHYRIYSSRTGHGVANENYFDRYFAMGIPDHDVSDVSVRQAALFAHHGDLAPLEDLVLGTSNERQLLVLGKLADRSNAPRTDEECLAFAGVLALIADQVEVDDGTTFSALDQILMLTAAQLARLSPAATPDHVLAVLGGLRSNALRIRVRRFADHELEQRRIVDLAWPTPVTAALAGAAVSQIVDNLAMGDTAPDDDAIACQIDFAVASGDRLKLREKIYDLLCEGTIDLSTVASRLVSSRTFAGVTPDWQLSPDVDQSTFDLLVPADDDPWYHEPPVTVDLRDRTWENKRRFATGRFRRPPSVGDALEPGEDS
jgi:hypothetical protein